MLKNKIALITGASRGIGRELALRFSREGIHVAITGRDEKELKQVADEIKKNGIESLIILADLKDKNAPGKIISEVVKKFGALDILINNAGFAINKPFEKHSIDEWEDLMAINSRAPFFITQAALPYLKKSSLPTVINISSAVGRLGYPDQAAYTASKHALMGWTKSLAKEVQKDGIRVHVIAPGGVATDMIAKMRPDIKKEELIQTKEIADVVMFLLSLKGNAMIDELNLRRFTSAPWQ
jgi:3-oxoacyl-[acyl-carrier protein] reductase